MDLGYAATKNGRSHKRPGQASAAELPFNSSIFSIPSATPQLAAELGSAFY